MPLETLALEILYLLSTQSYLPLKAKLITSSTKKVTKDIRNDQKLICGHGNRQLSQWKWYLLQLSD